jgi:hypothetical protein
MMIEKGEIKHQPRKPTLANRFVVSNKFGAQIEGHFNGEEKWLIPNRIYQITMRWDDYYDNVTLYDQDVQKFAGYQFGFGIRCVPQPFRLWPTYRNSPLNPQYSGELLSFLTTILDRYNPTFIELFNEPNIGRDQAKSFEDYFGAWMIDEEAPDVAGNRYREMLASVYPFIKQYHSKVKIHAGALMNNAHRDGFLKGMFPKGDRSKLADAVSFHYYVDKNSKFYSIKDQVAEIRKRTSLPLVLSETSALSYNSIDAEGAETLQYDWFKYLVRNKLSLGIDKILWYTLANNGWWHSDMVMNDVPKLVYQLFAGRGWK